jgi:hypothetical protein
MQIAAKKNCGWLGIGLYAESADKMASFYKRFFHVTLNILTVPMVFSHNNEVLVIRHNCYITVPL